MTVNIIYLVPTTEPIPDPPTCAPCGHFVRRGLPWFYQPYDAGPNHVVRLVESGVNPPEVVDHHVVYLKSSGESFVPDGFLFDDFLNGGFKVATSTPAGLTGAVVVDNYYAAARMNYSNGAYLVSWTATYKSRYEYSYMATLQNKVCYKGDVIYTLSTGHSILGCGVRTVEGTPLCVIFSEYNSGTTLYYTFIELMTGNLVSSGNLSVSVYDWKQIIAVSRDGLSAASLAYTDLYKVSWYQYHFDIDWVGFGVTATLVGMHDGINIFSSDSREQTVSEDGDTLTDTWTISVVSFDNTPIIFALDYNDTGLVTASYAVTNASLSVNEYYAASFDPETGYQTALVDNSSLTNVAVVFGDYHSMSMIDSSSQSITANLPVFSVDETWSNQQLIVTACDLRYNIVAYKLITKVITVDDTLDTNITVTTDFFINNTYYNSQSVTTDTVVYTSDVFYYIFDYTYILTWGDYQPPLSYSNVEGVVAGGNVSIDAAFNVASDRFGNIVAKDEIYHFVYTPDGGNGLFTDATTFSIMGI